MPTELCDGCEIEVVLRITLGFLASVMLGRGENMGRNLGLEYREMVSCRRAEFGLSLRYMKMLKRQLAIQIWSLEMSAELGTHTCVHEVNGVD